MHSAIRPSQLRAWRRTRVGAVTASPPHLLLLTQRRSARLAPAHKHIPARPSTVRVLRDGARPLRFRRYRRRVQRCAKAREGSACICTWPTRRAWRPVADAGDTGVRWSRTAVPASSAQPEQTGQPRPPFAHAPRPSRTGQKAFVTRPEWIRRGRPHLAMRTTRYLYASAPQQRNHSFAFFRSPATPEKSSIHPNGSCRVKTSPGCSLVPG